MNDCFGVTEQMGNWNEHRKRLRSEQQWRSPFKRKKIENPAESPLLQKSDLPGVFAVGKRSLAFPVWKNNSSFQSEATVAAPTALVVRSLGFPALSPLPRALQGPQRDSVRYSRISSFVTEPITLVRDRKKEQWKRKFDSFPPFQGTEFSQEQVFYRENSRHVIMGQLPHETHNDSSRFMPNYEEDLRELEEYKRRVHAIEQQDRDSSFPNGFPGLEVNKQSSIDSQQPANSNTLTTSVVPSTSLPYGTVVSLPSGLHQETQSLRPKWKDLHIQVKSDFHLDDLGAEIQRTASQLSALQVTRKEWPRHKSHRRSEDEVVVSAAFAPLSKEEEDQVDNALGIKGHNRRELLVIHEKSNIEITRAAMQCLAPGVWLNDEVINLNLELLKEREQGDPDKFLKCHFFNTFFYNKLYRDKRSYDFKAVRRWTTQRKLGYSLLECDKVFVPIHKKVHWCLAVINVREKKLEYLDSLKGEDDLIALQVLARYIVDEAKDKLGQDLDVSTWEHICPQDIPKQLNGCDCGMFMVKYVDFHSRGVQLKFTQEHMEYFRRRMVLELLRLKAK